VPIEIIVAIIGGSAIVLAAIITTIAQSIKNKSNVKAKKQKGVILQKHICAMDLTQFINNAQSEIYIYTHTPVVWDSYVNLLLSRENISLKILIANPENGELLKAYNEIRNRSYDTFKSNHAKCIQEHKKLEIRIINSFMPVTFLASDIYTDGGYIRAYHHFNGSDVNIIIKLTKDNKEWYDFYQEKLEILWNRGLPYSMDSY